MTPSPFSPSLWQVGLTCRGCPLPLATPRPPLPPPPHTAPTPSPSTTATAAALPLPPPPRPPPFPVRCSATTAPPPQPPPPRRGYAGRERERARRRGSPRGGYGVEGGGVRLRCQGRRGPATAATASMAATAVVENSAACRLSLNEQGARLRKILGGGDRGLYTLALVQAVV